MRYWLYAVVLELQSEWIWRIFNVTPLFLGLYLRNQTSQWYDRHTVGKRSLSRIVCIVANMQYAMSLQSCSSKAAIFHDFLSENSGRSCAQITCLPHNSYTNRYIGDTLYNDIDNILLKRWCLWT